jgi:hypothetical protein
VSAGHAFDGVHACWKRHGWSPIGADEVAMLLHYTPMG